VENFKVRETISKSPKELVVFPYSFKFDNIAEGYLVTDPFADREEYQLSIFQQPIHISANQNVVLFLQAFFDISLTSQPT